MKYKGNLSTTLPFLQNDKNLLTMRTTFLHSTDEMGGQLDIPKAHNSECFFIAKGVISNVYHSEAFFYISKGPNSEDFFFFLSRRVIISNFGIMTLRDKNPRNNDTSG